MLESLFNKVAGLKASNSIKKRLQHNCFPVKSVRTPLFTGELQWWLLSFNSSFQRSAKETPMRLLAINTRFSLIQLKKYFLPRKSRSSYRRCSVKEGVQGAAQVFSCEYCEIFKNIYFEKHLWTVASENQHLSNKFTEGS